MAVLSALLTGCINIPLEIHELNDPWAGLRRFADQRPMAADTSASAQYVTEGYAILLESFEGADAPARAQRLIKRLSYEAKMPDLWIRDYGKQVQVMRGRYTDERDPAAQSDLRQTRMVVLDGLRPYEKVQIIRMDREVQVAKTERPKSLTPEADEAVAAAARNLRLAEMDLKSHHGSYSLQMAYYDDNYGPDFRKAAEQACLALRADGDEAYFYHGPNRSLVTVGLFTEADFGVEYHEAENGDRVAMQVYGPRVRELQKKHQYNLANGLTQVTKYRGQRLGEQPSFLVQVP